MKTKGLNFLEAVQAMREGKKGAIVKSKRVGMDEDGYYFTDLFIYDDESNNED